MNNIKKISKFYFLFFLFLTFNELILTKSNSKKMVSFINKKIILPNYNLTRSFSISEIGNETYKIQKPVSLELQRNINYSPANQKTGVPMIKIEASSVILDCNNQNINFNKINNNNEVNSYCIGIEVGYSPYELSANPNLKQPSNITIKNCALNDFSIGILVHQGVKNITFENINILNSPLSIVFIGAEDKKIVGINLKNIFISNSNSDDLFQLIWAKTLLEETNMNSIADNSNNPTKKILNANELLAGTNAYGYGTDAFMPLGKNPVTNLNDAYFYSGIYLKNCVNCALENITISDIGYNGLAHYVYNSNAVDNIISEHSLALNSDFVYSNGAEIPFTVSPTNTFVLQILNSADISCDNLNIVNNFSGLNLEAIKIKASNNIFIANSIISNNSAHQVEGAIVTNHDAQNNIDIADDTVSIKDLITALENNINFIFQSDSPNSEIISNAIAKINIYISRILAGVSLLLLYSCMQKIILELNEIHLTVEAGPADINIKNIAETMIETSAKVINLIEKFGVNLSGRTLLGINIEESNNIDCLNVQINKNSATNTIIGMIVKDSKVCDLNKVFFNYNETLTDTNSTGILNSPASQSILAAGGMLAAIMILSSQSLNLKKINLDYNKSSAINRALFINNSKFCNLKSISCSNFTSLNSTDENTFMVGCGILNTNSINIEKLQIKQNSTDSLFYGLLIENCNNCEIIKNDITDNYSVANNSNSFGFCINYSNTINLSNCNGSNQNSGCLSCGLFAMQNRNLKISDSKFSSNKATGYAINEASAKTVSATASKLFSTEYLSGGVGVLIKNSNDLILSNLDCLNNNGKRAAGIVLSDSETGIIEASKTSAQFATGDYFIDSAFDQIDLSNLTIPQAQLKTLFGNASIFNGNVEVVPTKVNVLAALKIFLNSVGNLNNNEGLKNKEFQYSYNNLYSIQKDFVCSLLLIQAALTQFKLFSTAVGIHLNSTKNFSLISNLSSGNTSQNDSAAGCAITGSSEKITLKNNKFINNSAWLNSKRFLYNDVFKYNLSAVQPFWESIFSIESVNENFSDFFDNSSFMATLGDPNTASAVYNSTQRFVKAQILDINPLRYQITLGGVDYWFTNPIGGAAFGLCVIDSSSDILIDKIELSDNNGNSGQAYGYFQSIGGNCSLSNSKIFNNSANILGFCYGIAELTIQSNSIYMSNMLFGNSIDKILNYNFLVPLNPLDKSNLSFQVKRCQNSEFSKLANYIKGENIEFKFSNSNSENLYLSDNIARRTEDLMGSDWEINNYIF